METIKQAIHPLETVTHANLFGKHVGDSRHCLIRLTVNINAARQPKISFHLIPGLWDEIKADLMMMPVLLVSNLMIFT